MNQPTDITVTHRGFIRKVGLQYPAQVRLSQEPETVADTKIIELNDKLHTLVTKDDIIAFTEEAIKTFNRLMPDFKEFMVRNMIFSGKDDYRYKLFLSIEKFVLTGNAGMSPFTFIELMGEFAKPATYVNLYTAFKNPFNMEFFSLQQHELLCKWLSHDGGLEHLIETMFVLFGDDMRRPVKHRLLPRKVMV